MRPDQLARLKSLSEKLTDCVLDEADPDLWPGAGAAPDQMSKDERGDRFWCKKNAAATFALVVRCEALLAEKPGGPGEPDEDVDSLIAQSERKAASILRDVMAGASRGGGRGD